MRYFSEKTCYLDLNGSLPPVQGVHRPGREGSLVGHVGSWPGRAARPGGREQRVHRLVWERLFGPYPFRAGRF
jgi:hypothetical protein